MEKKNRLESLCNAPHRNKRRHNAERGAGVGTGREACSPFAQPEWCKQCLQDFMLVFHSFVKRARKMGRENKKYYAPMLGNKKKRQELAAGYGPCVLLLRGGASPPHPAAP